MPDGIFWNDTRTPHFVSDLSAVTLSTTAKALYGASAFPYLGPGYFDRPGKKLKIRLFGKMTTGATPGNFTWAVYYGTGADADGVLVASSTATALVASGTNLSWSAEFYIRCVTTGSTGTLYCTGTSVFNIGLLLSTVSPILIPGSAAAASGACDLTAAKIISIQALRSGSTAETMTVQDMEVISVA